MGNRQKLAVRRRLDNSLARGASVSRYADRQGERPIDIGDLKRFDFEGNKARTKLDLQE
ncbi:hypothetical protein AB2N08_00440 [Massilia aurea]|uniref:hypothetical protein n=1 Tax=Massilia aurea TaxID=373040 RepID=UPI00346291E2